MSLIADHFDAVRSRLNAHPMIANQVYDIARTGTAGLIKANYLILFGGPPESLNDDRAFGTQQADSTAEFIYTVRAVGTTPAAVRAWSDAAFTQLVGHVLTIPGRKCDRIILDDSTPIQEDKGATPSLYYSDTDYLLRSSRA